MNTDLWVEFGIDYKKVEKDIENKGNKGLSLSRKIADVTFNYIKNRFNLAENQVGDALNNLWMTNPELFKDLYIVCKHLDYFKEDWSGPL